MADDKLNPDISPSGSGKAAIANSGVKKLNKIPLLIIGAVAFILIAGLGFATIKRGEQQAADQEKKITKVDQDGEMFAKNMLDDLYNKSEREKVEPTPEKMLDGTPTQATTDQRDLGSALSNKSIDNNVTAMVDEAALERLKAKEKLYETAIAAPTKIKVDSFGGMGLNNPGMPNVGGTPGVNNPGMDIFKALAAAKGGTGTADNSEDRNTAFLKSQKESFAYLPNKKTPQISPYEIKTGTLIPGVLLSGINSDLPGPIRGQVRENVYDTATGEYLLIPQGTTLVGRYSANVGYGQERAMVVWQRMVFPDGQTVNIGAMNGMDQEGYAGFADEVDNHYFRIFGSAFLLSMLGGEIYFEDGKIKMASSQSDYNTQQETVMQKTAGKMLDKQLGIAPTITIRPGFRFNIFVTQDMILEPLSYGVDNDGNQYDQMLIPAKNRQRITPGMGSSAGSNNSGFYSGGNKEVYPATSQVAKISHY
ncbi:MAG: hypothetical protein JXQ68_08065 [Campylobacterales bacterium]|nr:hypothetical protein [Campylobacterales bacterium]